MQCDLCGRTAQLVKARIEGVELDTCGACTRFGMIIARPPKKPAERLQPVQQRREPETREVLVDDVGMIIRKKREQQGMTQEEFARLLAERASLVQKIETGQFTPPIEMAKKVERILKIRLVVEEEQEALMVPRHTEAAFTLGDFIKKR